MTPDERDPKVIDLTPLELQEKHILIVEDESLFAYALQMALELDPGLAEAGLTGCTVASSVQEALDQLDRHHFEVALVDIYLPDGDGLSLGKEIAHRSPATKLVALTGAIEPDLAAAATSAGFGGYITKDVPFDFLVDSVLRVLADEVVIRVDGETDPDSGGRSRYDEEMKPRQLTLREHEVLSLLVRGAATDEIALELGVATNTARTHIQNVLTKLQVRSRLEAAAFAVRHGVTSPR